MRRVKNYLNITLQSNLATFSQFFLVGQNIKHEPFGITSITKPPK